MEPYIENFRQKGFGLFVHYGAYVQYQHGEWALNARNMVPEEYERRALACDFSSFNADHLVKAAKMAGARYITFTTRHHDGFSLYDTRGLSDYDVMHTPNGRDLVKEFVDACHKNDIMPFLYHTTLDWHNPDFTNDFPRYQQYLRDSVEILCKYYGEIGGFWFDGNWSKEAEDWELDQLYGVIRKYQPNAIIVNNTGLHAQGVFGHKEIDCVTFEQGVPQKLDCSGMKKECIGEMCLPICKHWGIAEDINCKSMPEILGALLSARRVGGNFLLGIFTNLDGTQPLLHQGYLEALGKWVRLHEEALFEPAPCEIESDGPDFALQKDDTLYFFFPDIETSGDSNVLLGKERDAVSFHFVTGTLSDGVWMGSGEPVEYQQDKESGELKIWAKGFAYGENWIARVAKFHIQKC